ncbi:hypothetical protein M976_02240 [Buttiauxella ferragutiae ATCC 51602]|uniref:Uncharacterized protein n=2 Tax=Buttiauxella ferragutiae TaxID=82989 RepID=A0ABX2W906_9ENTR|nr:hypothetical protein M976_02240 [Buttiauxella ferragutiae ATCC 51602]
MMNNKKIICIIMILICVIFFWIYIISSPLEDDEGIRFEAQNKVVYIQELYNQGKINEIYNNTTNDFKKIITENDFIDFMKRKKEVLGNLNELKLTYSNVINHNVVILTYRSTYDNYSLIEDYKFIRKNNKEPLYLGTYFIDDGGKRGEVIKLNPGKVNIKN